VTMRSSQVSDTSSNLVATGPLGTFNVNVPLPSGADQTNQLVAIPETFGNVNGENVRLKINDATGKPVSFTLKGHGVGMVTVGDSGFASLVLTGTDVKTKVIISTADGAETTITNISVDGSLGTLMAKTTDLSGNVTVTGSVGRLIFDDVVNPGVITIGSTTNAKAGTTLKFDRVSDLSINSAMPIKSIVATRWLSADTLVDEIHAPWLDKLTIAENFSADLDLTGLRAPRATLGNAKIGGRIVSGDWQIVGDTGSVAADAIASAWSAEFTGYVKQLRVNHDASGDITAGSIKTLRIGRDWHDAHLNLTQAVQTKAKALAKLSVAGWMDNVQLRSNGHIGSVSATGMRDSQIYAGVLDTVTGVPQTAADFGAKASIQRVSIRNAKSQAAINSHLAAWSVGRINLSQVTGAPGNFGLDVTAHDIKSVMYKDGSLKFRWPNKGDKTTPEGQSTPVINLV